VTGGTGTGTAAQTAAWGNGGTGTEKKHDDDGFGLFETADVWK